jgi:hypothetical protein
MSAGAPTRITHWILLVLTLCAGSPAAAQPVEAPNLPAALRLLVPRGWVATSFAEVDMNKDGNLDRAVLLAPNVAGNSVVGPIAGTPLRDRCRNLILQVGQPDGRPAVVNYIPWSQLPVQLGVTMATDTCLGQEPVPDFSASGGPIYFSDSLKSVRNTLRYPWEAANWPGQSEGTLVIRIEGSCLRLIGDDRTESNHGAAWQSSDESSTNYLTRENISSSSMLERCGADDCEDKWETTGPVTSKIEQRAPICLNDRPLLLSAPAPAPQQPSMPAPAPKQPPQPTNQRRPTSTAEEPYLPPSPLLPRTECLTPPMPMLEYYHRSESGFDSLEGPCDQGLETDACAGVARVMAFGDTLLGTLADAEYAETVIWAVDDCGLWLRDADYIDKMVFGWTPDRARRGRYFVVPRQQDGSYLLEREMLIGRAIHFTPISGNFLRVRVIQ